MKRALWKCFYLLSDAFTEFQAKAPALHHAFFFLIGIGGAISPLFVLYALPFLILKKGKKEKRELLLLLLFGFFFFSLLYPRKEIPAPIEGQAIFHIEKIRKMKTHFSTSFLYEGTLKGFSSEKGNFYRLPCKIFIPTKMKRPLASVDYLIDHCRLEEISPWNILLKVDKNTIWTPIEKAHSSAEARYQTKEKVKSFFSKHYQEQRVFDLLSGLVTGVCENQILLYEFSRLGLSHLLAISGFHFALLATFLTFLLKPLPSFKAKTVLLILLVSTYYLYMGESPSISRAWIAILLYLIATLMNYQTSPLTFLGLALLAALTTQPLVFLQVGFQLSFLATLGIFLFFRPFDQLLSSLLPSYSFKKAIKMTHANQWGVLFSYFLRKSLALNGAVILLTLPLLLFHFHKFPLLSLLYNLFFPFFFGILLFLLLLSLLLSAGLPPLGAVLHPITQSYSLFLLTLVSNAPKKIAFFLRVPPFSLHVVLIILIITILGGILLRKNTPNLTNRSLC
ncbi:MAG: ComEC/Rec2 family competence protein [Simkania negevensis]|nr:ComEC/Rec2 family competence protein [Simkania negevensis]